MPGPNDALIDEDGVMHIATGHEGIHVMSLDGKLLGARNQRGEAPGQFRGFPHGIWMDSAGDVYVAEVGADRAIQKFARI